MAVGDEMFDLSFFQQRLYIGKKGGIIGPEKVLHASKLAASAQAVNAGPAPAKRA